MYLHADMRLKERALAHTTASGLVPDRYRAPDPLLAFLDALSFFVAGLGIAELVADCAAWLASPRAGLLEETTATSSHTRVSSGEVFGVRAIELVLECSAKLSPVQGLATS